MTEKILIVGAGFSGASVARTLAENGFKCCKEHEGGKE